MTRRTLLAAAAWSLALPGLSRGGTKMWAQHFTQDCQIFRAQQRCDAFLTAYQEWRKGRSPDVPAAKQLDQYLLQLQSCRRSLASQAQLTTWLSRQVSQLQLLRRDLDHPEQRLSRSQLQQRWRVSLELESELLSYRRQQLLSLSQSTPVGLKAYLSWWRRMLPLLQQEVSLAAELAKRLEQQSQLEQLDIQALGLFVQAQRLTAPAGFQKAHEVYVARFVALRRLVERAGDAQGDIDLANSLRAAEAEYRKWALASEEARLRALALPLGLTF